MCQSILRTSAVSLTSRSSGSEAVVTSDLVSLRCDSFVLGLMVACCDMAGHAKEPDRLENE